MLTTAWGVRPLDDPLSPHVDGGGIQRVLEVHGVVLLDHLDAGAAVLGDLVDVAALQQPEAHVRVAEAVGGPPVVVAVELQALLLEDGVEQATVVSGENLVRWLRGVALHQTLERPHRPAGALAVAEAPLAPYLDLQNDLAGGVVLDDVDIAVLKALGLVGAQPRVGHEQDVVVQLLVLPLPAAREGGWR